MKALILVDLQNDFMPGGALAVSNGNQVVPIANRLIISDSFDVIVLTQDWHPPRHSNFASVGGLWPDHCIWGLPGAEFHKNLLPGKADMILRKGTNKDVDSYSGFYDNASKSIGLAGYLHDRAVTDTYIMGLATDYCVKFTALDSIKCGFNTHLIIDGCRAVANEDAAVDEMKAAGIILTQSDKLISSKLNG